MAESPALDGVRILDLASVGPGARASRILSDYGADVVKIGPVPSANGIGITPPFYAYSGDRLMKRASFDLKSDSGRSAFLTLAAEADVIIESFRPGVVDRLGIDYHTVRSTNPGVVYCSISGFGQEGPRSAWAAHDLNYLALSGYLHCSGRGPDNSPVLPGATVADIAAGGMQAAMSVMAALLGRAGSGNGRHLDVSIADGAFALMSLYVDEYLATGTEPGPGHYILTGRYACYGIYTCSDGLHISVGAIEPRFWRNLLKAVGLERYADLQLDDPSQNEIREALADVFRTRTRDDWTDLLGPADCCVAPVLSVAEAVHDPHLEARGLLADAVHDTKGSFRQTGPVWAGTVAPGDGFDVRDATVTDTPSLLTAAGLDAAEIRQLIKQGAIA